MSEENRSRKTEITDQVETHQVELQGVGGRQIERPLPLEGGGYLDTCKKCGAALLARPANCDPRLDELEQLGLGDKWVRIARALGFDLFMTMWRILDEENARLPSGCQDAVRVRVPRISKFQRFQRNKLIVSLKQDGKSSAYVKKTIRDQLRENISITHINRVYAKTKIKK